MTAGAVFGSVDTDRQRETSCEEDRQPEKQRLENQFIYPKPRDAMMCHIDQIVAASRPPDMLLSVMRLHSAVDFLFFAFGVIQL
jgi:hypothetical protein